LDADYSATEIRILSQAWTWVEAGYSKSKDRHLAGLSPILAPLVRAFDPVGHIFVAVIHFINLLHAVERFFPLAHFVVNDAEVVDDLLFRRVHCRDFGGRVFKLLHREIEHAALAIANA